MQCPRVAREAYWKACASPMISAAFPREARPAKQRQPAAKVAGGKREITVEPSSQRSGGLAVPHIYTNAYRHSRRWCKIHECLRRKRVNERAAERRAMRLVTYIYLSYVSGRENMVVLSVTNLYTPLSLQASAPFFLQP